MVETLTAVDAGRFGGHQQASASFFVLVGARQVEDLDEVVDLTAASDVAFVKLVQLVGG